VGAQQASLIQGPAWTLGARVAAVRTSGCDSPGKYRPPFHTYTCMGVRNALMPLIRLRATTVLDTRVRLRKLLTAYNSRLCIWAATDSASEAGAAWLLGGVQVTCRHVRHDHSGIAHQERAPAVRKRALTLTSFPEPHLLCAAGPGEYHRPQCCGMDGPAFSLAGRLPGALTAADAALRPGPGQYEVPAAPGGAAFTIAGRLQTVPEQQDSTPGPGRSLRSCADYRNLHSLNDCLSHIQVATI
jgi:hypothetical protein